MKITTRPGEKSVAQRNRAIANEGCNVCPTCGESRSWSNFLEFPDDGKLHGISNGLEYTENTPDRFFTRDEKGKFRLYIPGRIVHKDCWECFECGTKWESEPYTYY